jgi:two-component system phosphate regulon sensor histidine kinase PhoR
MKNRFLWQIFPSYLVIMLLALVAFAVNISFLIDGFYTRQIRETLEVRALLVQEIMQTSIASLNPEQIDAQSKQLERRPIHYHHRCFRLVLGDSDGTPQTMESHLMRPEVQQSLKGEVGYSSQAYPWAEDDVCRGPRGT